MGTAGPPTHSTAGRAHARPGHAGKRGLDPGPGGAAGTSTPRRQRGAPRAAPPPLRVGGSAPAYPQGARVVADGEKAVRAPGGTGMEMGRDGAGGAGSAVPSAEGFWSAPPVWAYTAWFKAGQGEWER